MPSMTTATKKRLADLRPTIRCMLCEQTKPAEGSRKFHSSDVCAECVRKLESKQ